MNGQEQEQEQLTPDRVFDLVEQKNMQWVDQFNQMLSLTAQAFQRLHTALDEKFTR